MQHQQQFTDQDKAQILLDCHKHSAQCLTNLALECSDNNVRSEVINALQTTLNHQQAIWQLMNHQGWYQPSIATHQDISKAQQAINKLPRIQAAQGQYQQQGQFNEQAWKRETTYVEHPSFY